MEDYGNKNHDTEEDVKIKVEEFDPRMFYQQPNCTSKPEYPQQHNAIKLTKAGTSGKDNSTYGSRLAGERNNNFGNSSNSSFQLKKEGQRGSESVLGLDSNDVYPEDTCAHCGKIFPGPISVRTHQIVHRLVPPKTKICCCGERFHLRSGLENHMRICRTSELLKQQQHEINNSTYYVSAREAPKPSIAPPPPQPPAAKTSGLISIVTTCPSCGDGAVALADIHAEPITFHCSQCGQEIKNVMFVRILQDGAAEAEHAPNRDIATGVSVPVKQEVSYIISDGANHGC